MFKKYQIDKSVKIVCLDLDQYLDSFSKSFEAQ